ncbi:hypothetical protein SERLA73DRAFT_158127 [Serpula lacrymans var. lacrymans S7.3]|uniref:BD-FAE-like domain-containing protein n=2 Tax=Serpula lacrymans var. lacrymans TaxID=341189 RepID=F8PJU2_SERL3|nr:uncharacterized protein SERLADRAFT_445083 [Serpula lacrymans var. lacrymans S7.9]EGO03502.1 hypothetical protein SERLA73DRAFT_158127 [Serpula lacrymans var. lacrymans S7.3]EGO29253.1 hypothetical protein SERLADRAFT_445083 [Serpula lacrymans var. lacrymans S7.9]
MSELRIKEIIDPGHPLLEENRAKIESIARKTCTYSLENALQLDIYYPSILSSLSRPPILLFFYGGGFTDGTRSSHPQNLVYNNVGAFFARREILTVIADYRLVPGAVFPDGSQDVRDALLWVMGNVKEGDVNRLYVLGHSAGGIHVVSMFLMSKLCHPKLEKAVLGVILMGVPYEISNGRGARLRAAAEKYYDGASRIVSNQPLGLLSFADSCHVFLIPPVRNILAESEPRIIKRTNHTFLEAFKAKGGTVEHFVLKGHDHLSPLLALSSGRGEKWGEEIVQWIMS